MNRDKYPTFADCDKAEKELFNQVFEHFQARYDHRNLEISAKIVYDKGKAVFNTDGYNLLYNLKRLCKTLEDELL